MHSAVRERLHMKTELQHAVSEGQFKLQYQPIVEIATGEISGFEALVAEWRSQRNSNGSANSAAISHRDTTSDGPWTPQPSTSSFSTQR